MNIVGGSYWEYCAQTGWQQLYGSGLRAAMAASTLSNNVVLSTYIHPDHQAVLKYLCENAKVKLDLHNGGQVLGWSYLYPLGEPSLNIHISDIKEQPSLQVNDEVILRFGLLECDAVVHGKYVVYDPQSSSPVEFSNNGSTAEHLALVLNKFEAEQLSGLTEIDAICRELLKQAEVVVLKHGALGAYVYTTSEGGKEIPVYVTDHVWKIGSGDVFSSIFTYYWGEKKKSPFEAAELASKATAYYCNTQSLPIPEDYQDKNFTPAIQNPDPTDSERLVYLAGPFFSLSQLWMVNETKELLEQFGLRVFSPFHHVGFGHYDTVAQADLKAIDECHLLFALVDGFDPGTLFEIGYARKRGIPVFAIYEGTDEEHLVMLRGSNCKIFSDLTTAIYHTAWKLLT